LLVSLTTIARHESAFWKAVQEGRLLGPAGEIGLWQIHPSLPEWNENLAGEGIEPVERSARVAADLLARARGISCPLVVETHGWFYATASAYGSGSSCDVPKLGAPRSATWATIASAVTERRALAFPALLALQATAWPLAVVTPEPESLADESLPDELPDEWAPHLGLAGEADDALAGRNDECAGLPC
jgi:hypothetical protein